MSEDSFDTLAPIAARAFLQRGFAAVSLRALAAEMGIQAASLYYHCPGGKAELFQRSLRYHFDRYGRTLARLGARQKFPDNLYSMAAGMLRLGPVELRRIAQVDARHLDAKDAKALVQVIHDAVLAPLVQVIDSARSLSQVRVGVDADLAASCVVALVESLGFVHLPLERKASEAEYKQAQALLRAGLSLLVHGLLPSTGTVGRASRQR